MKKNKRKKKADTFLIKALFICLFVLHSRQLGAGSFVNIDPYSVFLKTTWAASQRWHSSNTLDDNANYCWSAATGCNQDFFVANRFLDISIKECGLTPLDNEQGMGCCGGTWSTLSKLFKERKIHFSKQWCREHPWDVNNCLARLFYNMYKRELSIVYAQKLVGRHKISLKARKLLLQESKNTALDLATKSWFVSAWRSYTVREGWVWGDSRPKHKHFKDANDGERAFDYLCDIYSIKNRVEVMQSSVIKKIMVDSLPKKQGIYGDQKQSI
jgi:hypothetical protein